MKKRVLFRIFAVSAFVFSILLYPSSSIVSGTSLEYLLSQRMSIRDWAETPIEDEVVKGLFRSCFVSGFDLQGIELYMLNSSGTYQYDKGGDTFLLKFPEDARNDLASDVGEPFIANAPCIITVVWNDEIVASPLDAHRKAGIIIQNLYVVAVRHNLGGVCVGHRIYAEEVTANIQEHLNLPSNFKPMLLFPIGHLPEGKNYPMGNLQPTLGNLPAPLESNVDVLETFQKSHRLATTWKNVSLSLQKLSNTLWSIYGYSLLGSNHRTVPSAYGEYPFQTYVCNETGIYNYTAESHSLLQTNPTDRRSDVVVRSGAPEYLKNAPALLIFCWNSQVGTHNASDSDSKGRFINVGYGCCLQNLYLSAATWNISISAPFHAHRLFDPSFPNIHPMYVIGVGESHEDKTADLNGDGIVNVLDICIVAQAFGTEKGDTNYNPIADLDGNEKINIIDLADVANEFGKTV